MWKTSRGEGIALACLVIEVVTEEWYAAFYECLVERTAQLWGRAVYGERKYSAILEV